MTREDYVRLARMAVTGVHRPADNPEDCANPAAYDPPEWVLEAMHSAFRMGVSEVMKANSDQDVIDALRKVHRIEISGGSIALHHAPVGKKRSGGISGEALIEFIKSESR